MRLRSDGGDGIPREAGRRRVHRRRVQPTRVFTHDEAHEFLVNEGLQDLADQIAPLAADNVISAFIRAKKPA
jgi:hypothetical protein